MAAPGESGLGADFDRAVDPHRGLERARHRHRHGQIRPCRAQDRRDARLDRPARQLRSSGRGEPRRPRHGAERATSCSRSPGRARRAELAAIVTYAKRFAIPLIAMTSNADSALGREADICARPAAPRRRPARTASRRRPRRRCSSCSATRSRSRCWRPRASPRAISACCIPAASSGAKLAYVRDIMHSGDRMPRIAARRADGRRDRRDDRRKASAASACSTREGALAGIITDGDLRRHLRSNLIVDTPVEEVMTRSPRTIAPRRAGGRGAGNDQPQDLGAARGRGRRGRRHRPFPRPAAPGRRLKAPRRLALRAEPYGIGRPFRPGRVPAPAYRCRSSVVEHSLGKGEVESSILSGSTISYNSKMYAG